MNYEKIFYLNHLKRNYVVFDLGANKGYFTKLFCNIVGPFGEVHAFEPVKDTFLENIRGFSGNTPANLKLHNLAVGDRNTNIEILVPAGDYGQASLKSHKTGSWHVGQFEQVLCKMIRLDDYIQENSISVIDFIKCDIEGAEL
jgi:FkbM family methyltransferase